MRASLTQAGQLVEIDCRPPWLADIVEEACGDALRPGPAERDPDLHVVVTGAHSAFDVDGWAPLTRGAFQRDRSVVMTNACGSGFDLRLDVTDDDPFPRFCIEARFRPPVRERLAAWGIRSRFHLLTRAVLTQYPALWAAGIRGSAPLHASGVLVGADTVLVAGPGGMGRSSLLMSSLANGASACTDNVCVSDGVVVAGLVEPMRIDGAVGRRMPYGRAEQRLPRRIPSVVPTCVVVVSRGPQDGAVLEETTATRASEVIEAGTYMAGELRRYWSFAATLALGTGIGPVHPPVREVAAALSKLPAFALSLGKPPAPSLASLLPGAGVSA
ncbi:MAG: hypothetical protein ACXVWU_02430 [Nocardioides sp.]